MAWNDKSYWLRKVPNGYQRLYYFMGPTFLVSNLENKRVRLSKFSGCNDIFELASFSLGKREIRNKQRKWRKEQDDNVGLLCLSKNWKNPVMWGQYAEKGSGACLVLDVRSDLTCDVRYSGFRDKVTDDFEFPKYEGENHSIFRQFCTKKSLHWAYEEEVRVFKALSSIQEDKGNFFIEFDDDIKLSGVINGYDPRHGMRSISRHLDSRQNFFQCRGAFQTFEMVCQQNKSSWKP